MNDEKSNNPFLDLDHVVDISPDLKEKVMRRAERYRTLLAITGLFTTDYLSTVIRLAKGKEGPLDPE